jgi:microcin C transport system ATP-binding protein
MRKEAARAEILTCLDRVGIRNARQRLGDFPTSFPAANASA